MIVSLNEIETSCYRAALGVGLSHGLAQDAAAIGVKLLASRPDGLAVMLRALRFADAHPLAPPAFIREAKRWRPRLGVVPSLIAGPFAADLRQADPAAVVDLRATDELAVIVACLDGLAVVPPAHPLEVHDSQWRELQKLAARTYVPASEASRLRGAGAGLRDDD